jgi:cytochrome c-type biogenesis protein CcmH
MKSSKLILAFLALTLSVMALAQQAPVQEPMVFATYEQEQRFKKLTEELRCLVCQNQNLADSDALLAHDLKSEVHEMLLAGRTDDQIKQFMVERYGDFVLYRPPVQKNTYVLWLGPLLLLLGGAWILHINIKKRAQLLNTKTTDGENS